MKYCSILHRHVCIMLRRNTKFKSSTVFFRSGNPPQIQFTLSFQHELTQMFQTEVKRIISTSAPASLKGGYQVITIGDLDLIVSQISYTVSVSNYTEVTEFMPTPTTTMPVEMTSTPYISYCKLKLNLF